MFVLNIFYTIISIILLSLMLAPFLFFCQEVTLTGKNNGYTLNSISGVISICVLMFVVPQYFSRGEEVTLTGKNNVYTVNSGAGGLFGHTHELIKYNMTNLASSYTQDYDVLFQCDVDLYHAHPDANIIYGIKHTDNNIYNIGSIDTNNKFTPSTNHTNINVLETTAFHNHPIKITKITTLKK